MVAMVITFRPTRLVARRTHIVVPPAIIPVVATHTDWYVNEFTFDRQRYIILTNSYSLLSVVFAGRGLTTAERFADAAVNSLRVYLERAGHGSIFERQIMPAFDAVRFAKPSDRRVLGSMNDLIYSATVYMAGGAHSNEVIDKINDTPMSLLWNRGEASNSLRAFREMPSRANSSA